MDNDGYADESVEGSGENENVFVPLGSVDKSNHEPDVGDAHYILHALADGMCGVAMVVKPEVRLGPEN